MLTPGLSSCCFFNLFIHFFVKQTTVLYNSSLIAWHFTRPGIYLSFLKCVKKAEENNDGAKMSLLWKGGYIHTSHWICSAKAICDLGELGGKKYRITTTFCHFNSQNCPTEGVRGRKDTEKQTWHLSTMSESLLDMPQLKSSSIFSSPPSFLNFSFSPVLLFLVLSDFLSAYLCLYVCGSIKETNQTGDKQQTHF